MPESPDRIVPGAEAAPDLTRTADAVPLGHATGETLTHDGSPEWVASPVPSIAGYELTAVLGRGGMGVVYRAVQTRLKRPVALKLILGGRAGPAEFARFQTEAEAVAALHHPNVIQVFDSGEHDGQPYLAMELAAGGSLRDRLSPGPLSVGEAVWLAGTLAVATAAAHAHGIVHRDLKPANILFTADGVPKIADFGLAKRMDDSSQTTKGSVMGSPAYMAPEQAAGRTREVGPRTDVYALGAILYECLTGRPPFRGETTLETLDLVRFGKLVPPRRLRPDVPQGVEAVCLKALARQQKDRHLSASALAAELAAAMTTTLPPAGRRRTYALAAVVCVPLVGCLAALGVGLAGADIPAQVPIAAANSPPVEAEPDRDGPPADVAQAPPRLRSVVFPGFAVSQIESLAVTGGFDPFQFWMVDGKWYDAANRGAVADAVVTEYLISVSGAAWGAVEAGCRTSATSG